MLGVSLMTLPTATRGLFARLLAGTSFLGCKLEVDALEIAPGIALGEVREVKVMGSCGHEPFPMHRRNRANEVLGRKDELVVDDPLWLVVQHRTGMDGHHLIVLNGEIHARSLQVRNLHEKARGNGTPDIGVVVGGGKISRFQGNAKADARAFQLLADIVSLLHGAVINEVVPAPFGVSA